ncbi:MAG: MFS transporter, partial [Rudaea sp.]
APALGGALFAWQGLGPVVLLDSASFLFSAFMLGLIALPRAVTSPVPPQVKTPVLNFWDEWLAGLRVVARDRRLSSLFTIWGICMVSEGVIEVLLVPFVKTGLRGDAVVLGWLMTAQAAGQLLGGSAVGWLGQRVSHARWIVFGMLGWGLIDLGIFNILSVPLALALIVLGGALLIGFWVSVNVMLQEDVADEFRGRVFGAFGTTTALMTLVGMGASSVLGDRMGIIPVLNLACALLVAAGLVSWFRAPLSSPRIQPVGQA